jgi:hypothetical protein
VPPSEVPRGRCRPWPMLRQGLRPRARTRGLSPNEDNSARASSILPFAASASTISASTLSLSVAEPGMDRATSSGNCLARRNDLWGGQAHDARAKARAWSICAAPR